ncbi:MAG TPA: GGDEF domain-containing protein [Candidatus Nitrosotenuis sp.]|nr:GGDEF domain-containing protein [Candidatus Nitrosotenuis sp.]
MLDFPPDPESTLSWPVVEHLLTWEGWPLHSRPGPARGGEVPFPWLEEHLGPGRVAPPGGFRRSPLGPAVAPPAPLAGATGIPTDLLWKLDACIARAPCRQAAARGVAALLEAAALSPGDREAVDRLASRTVEAWFCPHTLLPGPRALEERLAGLDRPAAMLVLDLDGFKKVNDAWGHATGDDLLGSVAHGLSWVAAGHRAWLARAYRGDELLLLLPGPEDLGRRAWALAEACRKQVKAACREPRFLRRGVAVTASIGFAFMPPAPTFQALYQQADQAMYKAKKAGGDHVQPAAGDRATAAHPRHRPGDRSLLEGGGCVA